MSKQAGQFTPGLSVRVPRLAVAARGGQGREIVSFTIIPRVICLLFFTVGPRQRADMAIFKFTALAEAGKPLPVSGGGPTGRDFNYVDDMV